MKLKELTNTILTPIFFDYQVYRHFPDEEQVAINIQLSRLEKRNDLVRLKRGLYKFAGVQVNDFYLSNKLYQPSYVSLESALHYFGIIPEVPFSVTAITLVRSRKYITPVGSFIYRKVNTNLFFGWTIVKVDENIFFNIATPEKALVDYIYTRKIRDLVSARVDMSSINIHDLKKIIKLYPNWVRKIFHE